MTANSISHSDNRVRAIAHKLWVDNGMPEGQAESHWLQALEIANAEQLADLKKVAPPEVKAAVLASKKKPAAAAAKKASPAKRG